MVAEGAKDDDTSGKPAPYVPVNVIELSAFPIGVALHFPPPSRLESLSPLGPIKPGLAKLFCVRAAEAELALPVGKLT